MNRAAFIGLLASIVLIAGCGKGNYSQQNNSQKGNILRYPLPELTKLDPAMVQDGDTIDVIQQVFEGLVQWGEDSKVHPNLAEKWEVSKDGTVYTFHIKPGVKFSNGREVEAQDFKYSIERAADPKFASPTIATYLAAIVGMNERVNKKAPDVSGVKVVDKATLTITIDKPRPYFLGQLTYPVSFAVCKEALKDGAEITAVEQMIGTGPFIAKSFQPDQQITLTANKGYHEGAPKLDGIERPIIKDAMTRLNKFKNGELDITRIERQDIPGLKSDATFGSQIKYYDRPSLYYVGLNVGTYPPFKNKLVRQAFAMAIDKEHIVKDVLGGVNKVANSILPPGVVGFRENATDIKYNPTEAKRLLAQAGYPNGKGMPPLVLTHRDGQPDVALVAEAVVTELQTNLGIEVKTNKQAWTAYLDKHNKSQLDFFHMRWAADYLDPQNFLSTLLSTTGNENHNNYSNAAFDALCAQADTSMDEALRMQTYAKAEDMVLQDAPFIPIYFETAAELMSPRVKGIRESLFGHLPHTTTSLQ